GQAGGARGRSRPAERGSAAALGPSATNRAAPGAGSRPCACCHGLPRATDPSAGRPRPRPGPAVPDLAGDRQVVPGTGAVARARSRVVAPEALDGIERPVVAPDVVQPAGDGRGRCDALRVADPCALVAVLVRGVVVPAAEVLAVDHVLGAGVGDRLLDLVAHDDREIVVPAGVVARVD